MQDARERAVLLARHEPPATSVSSIVPKWPT